jgi:hypothetical protein
MVKPAHQRILEALGMVQGRNERGQFAAKPDPPAPIIPSDGAGGGWRPGPEPKRDHAAEHNQALAHVIGQRRLESRGY